VTRTVLVSDCWHKGSNAPISQNSGGGRRKNEARPDHWLELVLHVSSSALILVVEWQEGHQAHKKLCSTNVQRCSSGTGGGRGTEGEPDDPGSPGKMAVKQ